MTNVPVLIVAIGDFTGDVTGIDPVSRFQALPILDANDAAYLIATTAGTYAAVWDTAVSGTYCSSAAAFR